MKKVILLKTILLMIMLISHDLKAQVTFSNYLEDAIYVFDDTLKVLKTDIFSTYKSQFGLAEDDEMRLNDEALIENEEDDGINTGTLYSRYKQYYKGHEVETKSMSTASKCGVVLFTSGNVMPNLNIDVSDPISENDALDTALYHIDPLLGYTWEDTIFEASLDTLAANSADTTDTSATSYPRGALVITKRDGPDYEDIAENYALCWKFDISYFQEMTHDSIMIDSTMAYNVTDTIISSVRVYINANTGELWGLFDPSQGGYHNGDVWTWYHGHQTDIETYRGCFFCSNHLTDSRHIETYTLNKDANNKPYFAICYSSNNSWVNSGEKEPASAHWAVEKAYDYFKLAQGISLSATTMVVANNWSVSQPQFQPAHNEIDVPPGSGSMSFSSLDILGHEFTHAIIHQSSQMGEKYINQEAYQLSHAFGDIFGLAIETWFNGWCDWDWGDDYNSGIFKRSFHDPQYDHFPGGLTGSAFTYNDGNMYKYLSYSGGGPLRRWFNHLSQGEWDWTPAYSGIGFSNATRLSFVTMYWWLWAGSDYKHAHDASLKVAEVHYGGFCGPTWKRVERAWHDVGIGNLTQCKPFGLTTGKVIGTDQVTTSATHPAIFRVKNNFTDGETEDAIALSGYAWLLPSGWSGSLNMDHSEFTLEDVSDDFSSKMVGVVVNYTVNSAPKSDTFYSAIHFSTECNTEGDNEKRTPSYSLLPNMKEIKSDEVAIYPNPASNHLNVMVPNSVKKADLNITDVMGKQVYRTGVHGGYNSISLSGVASGIYFIRVQNSNMNIVKRIQIK